MQKQNIMNSEDPQRAASTTILTNAIIDFTNINRVWNK